MESRLTKQDSFTRVVEVDVPEEELTPHFDAALQKYRKTLRLEGFRKGKVPLTLVKKLFGDAIKGEAIDEVVQSVFQEVIEKEDLHPVAPAKLQDVKYEPGVGLHFKAEVEVLPDFELKKYTGLSVEKEVYQVGPEDIEEMLADVRERMAVMRPVEGEAEEGHFVLADFQQVDEAGLPIIGRKFEDRFFQLDLKNYQELSEQLLGVKSGETRQIQLPVEKEGAGEPAVETYRVTVKDVKAKELPALDDELAKDAGNFSSLEEFKEDIRANLTLNAQRSARKRLHNRLIDEVLKSNPFDIPGSMIEGYLNAFVEQAKEDGNGSVDEESLRAEYRPVAIWNIKWELVKDKIAELENITVTREDERAFIARVAKERGVEEKDVRAAWSGAQGKKRMRDEILELKVLEFLEQHAKIKEKKVTRKDLEKAREQLALSQ